MNIIIIDDDKIFLRELKRIVIDIFNEIGSNVYISLTDDPYSIIEDNIYKHYDIILLDIDMPNISGIEIASKINLYKGNADKPFIIFVTNRDGLVFDALREQPYSFIRKSNIEDLAPCLLKIYNKLKRDDTYIIKSGREIDRIAIKDIIYLEKQKNYVIFHTEGGDYKERTTIDAKTKDLSGYGFLRPHIGYLLNAYYIDEFLPQSVKLINGVQVPLSKKYRKIVKQSFFEWMVKTK